MKDSSIEKHNSLAGFLCGVVLWIIAFLMSGESDIIDTVILYDTGRLPLLFPVVFSAAVIAAGIYSVKSNDFAFFKGFSIPAIIIICSFGLSSLYSLHQIFEYGNSSMVMEIIISLMLIIAIPFSGILNRIDEEIYYLSNSDAFIIFSYVLVLLVVIVPFIVTAVIVRKKKNGQ